MALNLNHDRLVADVAASLRRQMRRVQHKTPSLIPGMGVMAEYLEVRECDLEQIVEIALRRSLDELGISMVAYGNEPLGREPVQVVFQGAVPKRFRSAEALAQAASIVQVDEHSAVVTRNPFANSPKPKEPKQTETNGDDAIIIEALMAVGFKKGEAAEAARLAVGSVIEERIANALSKLSKI